MTYVHYHNSAILCISVIKIFYFVFLLLQMQAVISTMLEILSSFHDMQSKTEQSLMQLHPVTNGV
mgnify:CR=1 FL=1